MPSINIYLYYKKCYYLLNYILNIIIYPLKRTEIEIKTIIYITTISDIRLHVTISCQESCQESCSINNYLLFTLNDSKENIYIATYLHTYKYI